MANITELRAAFRNSCVKVTDIPASQAISGIRHIVVYRDLPRPDQSRISARQGRTNNDGGWLVGVSVSIAIPDDASLVAGLRERNENPFDFAWSRGQWRELGPEFYVEVEQLLEFRFVRSSMRNEARREKLEQLSADAMVQMARQAEVLAAFPTASVDAWIFANTKYTPETFAALGKPTKRDRRRDARKALSAGK